MEMEEPLSSRRDFLRDAGGLSALSLFFFTGGCDSIIQEIENRPTRRNILNLPANDPIIQTYQCAVTEMKALPATDPRNWTRQAQIHNNFCPHTNWYLLPWHRAYLVYFERICRKLARNDSFALPYWNWTIDSHIPAPFWGQGNSLLDTTRVLTQSDQVAAEFVGYSVLEPILNEPNFLIFGSGAVTGQRDFGVSGPLEYLPHNNVHSSIGGDMGTYMSPLDPVFWCHHCMVDYCWVDWNINRNHSNTNDPNWTNKQFSEFCDENGAPVTVEVLTTVLFPILTYQYEASQIGTTTPRALSLTSKSARSLQNSLRAGAKVRLDFQQRFELKEAVEMAVGQPVARSIAVLPAQFRGVLQRNNSLRALLTIANVDLPQESDFFVRVFLNKPDADRQTPITDPHYAGSFGFFGVDHSGHQQTSAKPGFIVDVTDTLRRLNQSGEVSAANKVDLQFVPVPLHQPNPAVQRFTAGGLTIGLSSVSSK